MGELLLCLTQGSCSQWLLSETSIPSGPFWTRIRRFAPSPSTKRGSLSVSVGWRTMNKHQSRVAWPTLLFRMEGLCILALITGDNRSRSPEREVVLTIRYCVRLASNIKCTLKPKGEECSIPSPLRKNSTKGQRTEEDHWWILRKTHTRIDLSRRMTSAYFHKLTLFLSNCTKVVDATKPATRLAECKAFA